MFASRDAEKRRLRRSLALALVAVLVSAALATIALFQRSEAIAQRDRAKSRELAAASLSQLDVDPELGVLLANEHVPHLGRHLRRQHRAPEHNERGLARCPAENDALHDEKHHDERDKRDAYAPVETAVPRKSRRRYSHYG